MSVSDGRTESASPGVRPVPVMERAPALVPTQAAEAATRTGGSPGRGTGPRASDAAEPALDPAETYQLDSSAYSDSDAESLPDEEYDALVAEAEAGYTDEEVATLVARLKEEGLVNFLRSYISAGHSLRKLLLGLGLVPPKPLREPGTPDVHLLGFAKIALGRVLRRREKLADVNTVDDAVELLRNAKNIMVLSGAGISTSCGIPDFRSATGLYAQLHAEGKYELDDPQQMFDISYFREHPEVFFSFAKQIYPSNFVPSPCHRWIKLLESRGQLLRNYTQNIDTLESLAGVDKVLQCHGSFKTASCLRCKDRMPGSAIEPYIMSQTIPWCEKCRVERDAEIESIKRVRAAHRAARGKGKGKKTWDDEDDDEDDDDIPAWAGEPGIIKPDITFFGQALDSEFDECLFRDREEVDLLVIMGTSLKVAPVSEVLSHIPHSVPQIFINLTPVTHVKPDISLLGDADSIVTYLSDRLGWDLPVPSEAKPVKIPLEDAKWLHGDGDWSHLHMLRSKSAPEDEDEDEDEERGEEGGEEGEGVKDEDGESGNEVDGPAEGDNGDTPSSHASRSTTASARSDAEVERKATHLHITSTPDHRASGSPASDRPAKRSRVGSPANE